MMSCGICYKPARALEVQQDAFAPESAAIAAQFTAFVHDSMARDDNGDAVHAVGASDRARCSRVTDGLGQRLVRACFSVWNAEQFRPDGLFKGRARIDDGRCEATAF